VKSETNFLQLASTKKIYSMLRIQWKQFSRYFLILCIFFAVFVLSFTDDILRFYKNKSQIKFNENDTSIVNHQQLELDNYTFPEFRWCLKKDVTPPFDCQKLFNGTVRYINGTFFLIKKHITDYLRSSN